MTQTLYYIYILECSNGALYTGYTTNIERRYREHQQGTDKCKYTRSFPPVKLSACWHFQANISVILKIERLIKALTRKEKIVVINFPEQLQEYLQKHELNKEAVILPKVLNKD